MSSEFDQIKANLPIGLRAQLHEKAEASGRSLNNEIVAAIKSWVGETVVSDTEKKTSTIVVRLTEEMRAKLDELSQRGPYRISITSIIERGIELAADELARLK